MIAAGLPIGDRTLLQRGDITRLAVDAIVNAANSSLLVAAGWMARFIAPPVPSSWRSVAGSGGVRPARRG